MRFQPGTGCNVQSEQQQFSVNDAAFRSVITLPVNRLKISAVAVRLMHFPPCLASLLFLCALTLASVCVCVCRDVSAQLHREVVRSL